MLKAVSTYVYVKERLHPGLLDELVRGGAQAIEIFAARQHFDYANRKQHVREIAEWFRSTGIPLNSVHAPLYSDYEWGRTGSPPVNIASTDRAGRIDAMDEIKRALEVAESSRSRVLAQRSGRPELVRSHTVGDYRALARQARAVLVEYWLGESQSYLWVVTPREVRHYALPSAAALRPWIERYRGLVMSARDPLAVDADTGRKLYDLLLAPAADRLCATCRLFIVPDGDLYSLNLESLPTGSQPGRYFIERAAVTIAPSLDYLAR